MPNQVQNRWNSLAAIGAIAVAALLAYHHTFSVPLLLDDMVTIHDNPSIRSLWPLGPVLSPPKDILSAGRPFLNLTFAFNYAIGGTSVRGYHVLNLLFHILAGITLFGIVRVTLLQPQLKEKYGDAATLLALAVAILWIVHPVQTESVTYITQRTESLMGLFYLLTLYFFIRAALAPGSRLWPLVSITACALGMMTKEVMVSAPLLVLFYDRTFIAGNFRGALRQRWRIYLGLAGTWLVLAALMASSHLRSRSVGYGGTFTWWTYALTESKAVVGYLKLAFWPHPLVFDYGPDLMVSHFAEAAPYLLVLVLLLALTLLASLRWRGLGFLGAWFFLILAPSSSIVPLAGQPMAEHRLYLPSAAIVTLGVIGLYFLAGRKCLLIAFPALAIVLGTLTILRNSDYRDDVGLWNDTVSKCFENSRAHCALGGVLAKTPSRLPEAIAQYETALKLNPRIAEAHYSLGLIFAKIPGRLPDAIAQYEAALKISPNFAEAHHNLGVALAKTPGCLPEAIVDYRAALKLKPDYAEAHYNLGIALEKTGHLSEAIAQYETALKINPEDKEARNNLGNAFATLPDRLPEAIAQYEAALKIDPADAGIHNNLGFALAKTPGRLPEAIVQYEEAVRISPNEEIFHRNLGNALTTLPDRLPEAAVQYEAALKIDPADAQVHYNLGVALLTLGRRREAEIQFEAAHQLRPDWESPIPLPQSAEPR